MKRTDSFVLFIKVSLSLVSSTLQIFNMLTAMLKVVYDNEVVLPFVSSRPCMSSPPGYERGTGLLHSEGMNV